MDKARQKSEKILKDIEDAISVLYAQSPELKRAGDVYRGYMDQVAVLTQPEKQAYDQETDPAKKQKLKQDYINAVKRLTLNNKEYKRLIEDVCYQIALVNQQALDIINDNMERIYIINYNQVAVECKKVGIEVKND